MSYSRSNNNDNIILHRPGPRCRPPQHRLRPRRQPGLRSVCLVVAELALEPGTDYSPTLTRSPPPICATQAEVPGVLASRANIPEQEEEQHQRIYSWPSTRSLICSRVAELPAVSRLWSRRLDFDQFLFVSCKGFVLQGQTIQNCQK